ncbi:glycoside hydrolase family 13 protein [Virgisporangium aurantiacum]|uniref:Alpha-glucosidase n=1 Tax=Virgisporangium aurantiacum TaxID=175570 RepID=A0A8J4E0Q9_9ACTN|nr:glycoside hydrolase family 13 protein [Virgisporangium aurantiacum]GIJ55257.1 alpha-glucosidase [Virgisporangium aurantiacum]
MGSTDDWWRTAVIYQVYPRSFADSDGDGFGDLPGIAARLDHLADLGVDALWLSPFYPSPQADAGYDVADYRSVDPLFGTLADFDTLVARAKELGLRVIVDLVPNHSSDEHSWFRAAVAGGPGHPMRDRYVFRDGLASGEPPTGWESVFGGSAWTRITEPDGSPGQWYLHLFDVRQPDFNWDHPAVRAEFDDVLRFWLDRGVDGFRVDVAHGLVKQLDVDWAHGSSGPVVYKPDAEAPPMWDQESVHDIYREWRSVVDSYGPDRILVAEAWVEPPERLARYVRPDEMHQAFNFEYLLAPWNADALRPLIERSLAAAGAVGAPTTWVLSNHDVVRHASRLAFPPGEEPRTGIGVDDPQPDAELGLRRARAATLLMLALPGAAYLYQGEELGLPEHTTLPDDVRQDPTWSRSSFTARGRDGCRVPVPWRSDAPAYGFSPTGASWLPQPAEYGDLAPDRQRGVDGSTLELYRTALHVRRDRGLGLGSLTIVDPLVGPVLVARNGSTLIMANTGADAVRLPDGAWPLLSSGPIGPGGTVPPDTTVWASL